MNMNEETMINFLDKMHLVRGPVVCFFPQGVNSFQSYLCAKCEIISKIHNMIFY